MQLEIKSPLRWVPILIATILMIMMISCSDDFLDDVIDDNNSSANHDVNDDHGTDRMMLSDDTQ